MPTRTERGETFLLIEDYDAAIINELPEEGAKLGYHPLAKQVAGIAKDLTRKSGTRITGPSVAGRMGVLRHHGFVTGVAVQPVSRGLGYQRTKKGKDWARSVGGLTTDGTSGT